MISLGDKERLGYKLLKVHISIMKKYLAIISGALMLVVGGLWGVSKVSAMASIFMAPTYGVGGASGATVQTSATTTATWMTPGTGTTTVTLGTPLSLGMATKYDKARLYLEVSATNTPQNPTLNVRVEHSLNGVDWFSDGTTVTGTSTQVTPSIISIYVSTSTAYNIYGNINRVHQSFYIETPAAYNRAVVFSPVGGQNFTVWAALQPIKEVQVINQ